VDRLDVAIREPGENRPGHVERAEAPPVARAAVAHGAADVFGRPAPEAGLRVRRQVARVDDRRPVDRDAHPAGAEASLDVRTVGVHLHVAEKARARADHVGAALRERRAVARGTLRLQDRRGLQRRRARDAADVVGERPELAPSTTPV
jgi:hypothetical protein